MGSSTISFTEQAVKKYLDECICFWREQRDVHEDKNALFYVDAFQSVRMSIFGELLKE